MKYRVIAEANTQTVTLEGRVDETAEAAFSRLRGELTAPALVFDVAGISTVNSLGVSSLLSFFGDLRNQRSISLERCPPFFIRLCNMLPSLVLPDEVRSCFVEHECRRCEGRGRSLVDFAKDPLPEKFADLPCPQCKAPMTAAEDPEAYLLFLKSD